MFKDTFKYYSESEVTVQPNRNFGSLWHNWQSAYHKCYRRAKEECTGAVCACVRVCEGVRRQVDRRGEKSQKILPSLQLQLIKDLHPRLPFCPENLSFPKMSQLNLIRQYPIVLNACYSRGAWVAQSVERPTSISAQVVILSPSLGSLLSAPCFRTSVPTLSLPLPCLRLSLSFSKTNKQTNKQINKCYSKG